MEATLSTKRKFPINTSFAKENTCPPVAVDWKSLETYEGHSLPHWVCSSTIYHVVFRLADSIPENKQREWLGERDAILRNAYSLNRDLSDMEIVRLKYLFSEEIEKYLDEGYGSCSLAKKNVGGMVAESLRFFDGERYELHAYCVMPNHVHVIVEPNDSFQLQKIIHSWTSYTANRANALLCRSGAFWQHEAYDHIIRSAKEYRFQMNYIWNNPGKMRNGFVRWRK